MKWELEKVLSLPIGDDKKEWILIEINFTWRYVTHEP
jgi:hypothetical protein